MLTERQLVSFLPTIRCYATTFDGRPAEVDDMVQRVSERLWLRREKFEGSDDEARRWMGTVAHNEFCNVMRQRRRDPLHASLDVVEWGENAAAPERTEAMLFAKQAVRAVSKDPQARLIAFMARNEPNSGRGSDTYAKAAAHFRVPIGTIRSRLSRARDRLRKLAA